MKPDPTETPGKFTAPGEVTFIRILPGPLERVWAFLTDPEKRARWLAGGKMELRVGGRVELRFVHASLSPAGEPVPEKYRAMVAGDCVVSGKITRLEPPRLLAYTWGAAGDEGSEVSFELSTRGEGVQLLLVHRRLGNNPDQLSSVAAGWHTHIAILKATLGDETPPPFWFTHTVHEADYLQRLAVRSA